MSSTRIGPSRGPSLLVAILLIAGATGFLAWLYDLAFLDQYLNAHPENRPGSEHHVLSVIANILVSVCAFLSVALFFRSRKIKQVPWQVGVRTDASNRSSLVLPVQSPPRTPTEMVEVAGTHASRRLTTRHWSAAPRHGALLQERWSRAQQFNG